MLPLVSLHGNRVVIDTEAFLRARVSIATANVIAKMPDPLEEVPRLEVLSQVTVLIMQYLIKMSTYGITLVFIRDGEKVPEKKECREKRYKDNQTKMERIAEGRAQLEQIHPLARTGKDINAYKALLKQHSTMSKEENDYFVQMIKTLGWPVITAKFEGEKLCANLAREGLAAGVVSTDTDNHPLGAPMLIVGFADRDDEATGQPLLEVVFLAHILAGLKMTQAEFIDLCIVLGCDFGGHIKGVGEKRAEGLIDTHRSIEAIARNTKYDVTPLRHESCRKLFAPEATGFTHESKELYFNRDQFATYSRDVMQQYDLLQFYDQLVMAVKRIVPPRQVEFVKQTAPVSRLNITTDVLPLPIEPPAPAVLADIPPLPVAAPVVKKSRLNIVKETSPLHEAICA